MKTKNTKQLNKNLNHREIHVVMDLIDVMVFDFGSMKNL